MLALPQVTLVCVDSREPRLALAAMRRSMAQVRFGAALLFTDVTRLSHLPPDIGVVDTRIASAAEYSSFVLRRLMPYIASSHVLVVQWDGFVVNPQAWDPTFLQYDYIGAPWHDVPGNAGVGNGGFSLRSRRLLEAFAAHASLAATHPEDLCICRDQRERLTREHDILFAPRALAERFAFERTRPTGPSFGFHGLFNLPAVLPRAEVHALLGALPAEMMRGLDAHDLALSMIKRGDLDGAALIIEQRHALGMQDRRTRRLRWRLALRRLRRK
ncbi:MAG: hypothetical protein HY021_05465 [Burkholderiales bacterium]|nr:hypothetical protein [Burkholderiales bacterium]